MGETIITARARQIDGLSLLTFTFTFLRYFCNHSIIQCDCYSIKMTLSLLCVHHDINAGSCLPFG